MRIKRDISATEDPLKSEKSQPHTELPSSEHRSWEKESPQYLAVKMNQDPNCADETKNCRKTRCPLKELKHRLSHSQVLTWVLMKRLKGRE